jgi:NADH-quinone oxidoreductase subunit F
MDLHFTTATATQAESDAVEAVIGGSGNGATGARARDRRHLLLPVLHGVQERIGWISAGAVNEIARRLSVAPADIYGVATFYALFRTTPPAGAVTVHVCDDVVCMRANTALRRELDASGTAWAPSPCLGLCDHAPAALVVRTGNDPSNRQFAPADGALRAARASVHVGGGPLQLLGRVAKGVDPESLDAYRAHGGFAALQRAARIGRTRTIAEITASKLLGRGGAAFPTGRKMEAVANAPARPHYLICNADESEPGTFKDRVLMESDPFAIVEAIAIAACAIDCDRAFVYIRGEYPLATQRMNDAIAQAQRGGLLGDLEIEVRRGAGAYICGEETALFNSLEGKRGEPRSKPPFPVEAGLFGKPTLVNNVETLANLLPILLEGGDAYARVGTAASTGTRLFCLSGDVANPGLYEVPHGTTLGALLDLAGGVAGGRNLQAILLGGAAGMLAGPETLDLPLTFEDARARNLTLGSGVVMPFDERVDLEAVVRRVARFFREESCGQCVPCRVGTVRQEEALERRDGVLLRDIGRVMRDASICGLGQTAYNLVESAQQRFGLFAERRL